MSEEVRTETPEILPEKKQKRRMSPKAVLMLVGIVAAIILIIVGIIAVGRLRNNGERYAEKLGEQISVSPQTAQKYAHITLENASQFACINEAAADYPYLYESRKTVKISGVSIPEWVIYIAVSDNIVTDVSYYNYNQLQKYGNGVKTQAHVETAGITIGMSPDAVQHYIGFAPLRVLYTTEGMQEAYKYYYKDQNTGNTVSYVLYVNYVDDQAVSAAEEENRFILSMLTLH